jgi:acyl phosphate:glycerol-3-phosphate acyltransferase
MRAVLLVVLAYACGSLPIGVWVGRWVGVDVRRAGSGNIGATNVARTAGRGPGLVALFGDVAKGLIPAALARLFLVNPWLIALTGLAAVCGHLFSLFLRFSGGKGVATAFGVFVILIPAAAASSAVVFGVTAYSTRYVSLASMLAALALPGFAWACDYPAPIVAAAALVAALIVVRHRGNLSRLYRGKEPRFRVRSNDTARS